MSRRIAVCHNLPSGGAKRHTLEQVRELRRRGHELVEFALSASDLDYCSFAPYVSGRQVFEFTPVAQLRRRLPLIGPYIHAVQGLATLRQLARVNRRIAEAIDAQGFDCVLVKDCHLSMNPYVLRFLSTPSAFQCHHGLRHRLHAPGDGGPTGPTHAVRRLKDLYYYPASSLYRARFWSDERHNARSATRVLTNSRYSRDLIAQSYQVDAGVLYPGINTDVFRPLPLDRRDYVLCVGALIYGKGYRFLVSALARMDPSRRPSLFVAANSVDPSEEHNVRALATAAGVEIHVESIREDERLVQVYRQAKAFVYAPLQEALGMAPLEAMACGTPVVAVSEGGVCETVLDGQTGWLVERDEEAFAAKLEQLLADAPARRRMGEAGIEVVRRDWTWSRAVDRLEQELVTVHGR